MRNLAAQAEAIWPQEEPIFARHPPGEGSVLDLGCGTGEITARLAERFPQASFVGVDLEGQHLERARSRCAGFGSRVRFEYGDALALTRISHHVSMTRSKPVENAITLAGG